jgi:hypothetical protein
MSADATPMGFPERRQHGTKRSMAEPGAKTLAVLQFDKSSAAIGGGVGVHRRLPQQ